MLMVVVTIQLTRMRHHQYRLAIIHNGRARQKLKAPHARAVLLGVVPCMRRVSNIKAYQV